MKIFREIAVRTKFFLIKLTRLPRQINTARSANKDFQTQAVVAEKLDNYVADFLSGKIEKFVAVAKKPELVGKKIIWQFWQQGIDENTPKLVLTCFDSVKKYRGEYKVIILSQETLNDYIELPDFVWQKFGTGGFVYPKLANLVRLYLLSAYGGVWLDATIYLTAPIDEKILEKDFFALQRSKTPPPDLKIFTQFDPTGLSWESKSFVRMQNSFMVAKPNNKIVADLLSIHFEYWRKEPEIGHYFFFQIMFNRMMQHEEWAILNCETVCYADFHRFLIAGFSRFHQAYYNEITARWNVHKLSLHWARKQAKKQIPTGSFADVIVNGKAIADPNKSSK
jgi:hypothetical protein